MSSNYSYATCECLHYYYFRGIQVFMPSRYCTIVRSRHAIFPVRWSRLMRLAARLYPFFHLPLFSPNPNGVSFHLQTQPLANNCLSDLPLLLPWVVHVKRTHCQHTVSPFDMYAKYSDIAESYRCMCRPALSYRYSVQRLYLTWVDGPVVWYHSYIIQI